MLGSICFYSNVERDEEYVKLHVSLNSLSGPLCLLLCRLLLGSEPSATASGSEKTATMPLGSSSSLNSEDGSSVPYSPTRVSPGVKVTCLFLFLSYLSSLGILAKQKWTLMQLVEHNHHNNTSATIGFIRSIFLNCYILPFFDNHFWGFYEQPEQGYFGKLSS